MSNQQIYTSKNGEAKTLDDWSKETGIKKDTIQYRINRGMTIDEALIDSSTAYSAITDPISGETHSLKEWAEITGLAYTTLILRIKKGFSIEKVLYGEKNATLKENPNYHNRVYTGMDLTGKKFGKLTVLKRCDAKREGEREWRWVCQCDCEDHNIVEVIQHNLLNGHCNSCGCSSKNKPKDMTGMKFGHLTVIEEVKDKSEAPENLRGLGVLWRCQCDCPNHTIVIVPGGRLRSQKNLSCGCQAINKVDGESKTDIYNVYRDMIYRCTNPNDPAYKDYGERGIGVCEDWMPRLVNGRNVGYFNFKDWALSHGYSKGLSIDRENNNGGYSPDNCRFVTMKVQNNNRRSNRLVEYNGETKTSTELAEEMGMNPYTFRHRLNRGMSVEDAIETPVATPITITTSFGETHTEAEWSEITGIPKRTLHSRVYHLCWNADMALTVGATNPDIYNHIPYGFNPSFYNPANSGYIPVYTDILGRNYTPEEWVKHQAIFFD